MPPRGIRRLARRLHEEKRSFAMRSMWRRLPLVRSSGPIFARLE